jgi:hypothetical protein
MTQQVLEKTILSTLGYGVMMGISFGMKYHSFAVGLLASLVCCAIYGGVMYWQLNSTV